jgi:hypothetical protein
MNGWGLSGLWFPAAAAAIASVLGLIVTAAMLPETKGGSLEETENEDVAPVEKPGRAA